MQLASHGLRRVANFTPQGGGQVASRSIHIPSFIPRARSAPGTHTAQQILSTTRHFLSRFVTHLTAPGLAAPSSQTYASYAHHGARTIQQGLSLPVRHALSRPLGNTFLPRAPALPRPNCVTHVGLGTARGFHAGRPLFQNVVENVPIAGRAFLEADWELKMRKERAQMKKAVKAKKERTVSGEKIKPRPVEIKQEETVPEVSEQEAEIDHYFLAPAVPEVTTYLIIPLAPTPTARVPLSSDPPASVSLLPLATLVNMHSSHSTHALRVSSLFARLDVADVWARGATCSAHGTQGTCTLLRIEFSGWSAAQVRGIIGESGTGWCALEEVRVGVDEEDVSDMSSVFGDEGVGTNRSAIVDAGDRMVMSDADMAQSFVLPTLDFSSSFAEASSTTSLSHFDESDDESSYSLSEVVLSDLDSLSDTASWADDSVSSDTRASSFGLSFSSQFESRVGEYEPRESAFY